MVDGNPRRLCGPYSPLGEGRGQSGLLANRSRRRFGTNVKLCCEVIGPTSTLNDYLNTVFNDVVSQCVGTAETMPFHRPQGKSFNLLKSHALQERNMLFVDLPVKQKIHCIHLPCMIVRRALNAISDRNLICFVSFKEQKITEWKKYFKRPKLTLSRLKSIAQQ